jgi:hypothetical protein
MAIQIILNHGEKAALPATAGEAEPLYTTDTGELFFGSGTSPITPLKVDWGNLLNVPAGSGDGGTGIAPRRHSCCRLSPLPLPS